MFKPKKEEAHAIDVFAGMRLREARILAGISQEELGNVLGVTFQQIQKYERGLNRLSAGALKILADFLGKDVSYFFLQNEHCNVISGRPDGRLLKLMNIYQELPSAKKSAVFMVAKLFHGGESVH